jgi:hypothetical protein
MKCSYVIQWLFKEITEELWNLSMNSEKNSIIITKFEQHAQKMDINWNPYTWGTLPSQIRNCKCIKIDGFNSFANKMFQLIKLENLWCYGNNYHLVSQKLSYIRGNENSQKFKKNPLTNSLKFHQFNIFG